jgi:hypothetical protein
LNASHGVGMLLQADGSVSSGIWKDGKFLGWSGASTWTVHQTFNESWQRWYWLWQPSVRIQ